MLVHSVSRFEKNKNHAGEIVSIFLAVNVQDDQTGESAYVEHWLTESEKVAVLANKAAIKPIINRTFAKAEIKMQNDIDTRPQPTIFMDEQEKEEVEGFVDLQEIEDDKDEIRAEGSGDGKKGKNKKTIK